jgi:2-(1,2-epoxy-1,2-dihydrophenyl)acetyl-CoA isomerase
LFAFAQRTALISPPLFRDACVLRIAAIRELLEMTTLTAPLLLRRNGTIATIELNRPEIGNAVDVTLARALLQAAIACDEEETIRCVVLRGSGRMFCVGGDVRTFFAAGDAVSSLVKEITACVHAAMTRFAHMKKPLLTAINGPAAGVGLSLALLGDVVIAARAANFTMAYTALGLSPDGGATWLLPRLVGLRKAQELALLNACVTADEAVTLGLITHACEDAAFTEQVQSMADRLATAATPALGKVRNLLLDSFNTSLEQHMEAETQAIAELSRAVHGREGVAAFVAKRPPNFS